MRKNNETPVCPASHISKSLLRNDPPRNPFSFTSLVATRQMSNKEVLVVDSFSFLQARTAFLAASSVSSVKLFKFNEDFLRIAHLFNENHEIKPFLDSLGETIKFTETLPLNARKNLFLFYESTIEKPHISPTFMNAVSLGSRIDKAFDKLKNVLTPKLTKKNLEPVLNIIAFQCVTQTDPEILKALFSFGDSICICIAFLIVFNKSND